MEGLCFIQFWLFPSTSINVSNGRLKALKFSFACLKVGYNYEYLSLLKHSRVFLSLKACQIQKHFICCLDTNVFFYALWKESVMTFVLFNLLIFSGMENIARCIQIFIYLLYSNKINIILFHILIYFFTHLIHTLRCIKNYNWM